MKNDKNKFGEYALHFQQILVDDSTIKKLDLFGIY